MQKNIMQETDGYAARHRRHRIWKRVVGGLACLVVFCTTYALILPAITLENTACTAAELTDEEQAQVDEVIALIDALPTQEEITETLTDFDDAGDEDGYDAYLAEIVVQAKAAHEAYEALTDAQKLKVTNAAKLMELEWIWSAATLETDFPVLTDDSARVTGITGTGISDGVAPWDANDTRAMIPVTAIKSSGPLTR